MFTFDANNNLNVNSVAPATQPVSGTVTANQGTANTSTNAWPVKVTDGTTVATVIAATAALKTDLSSVAGTAVVTSLAGVQEVGIVAHNGNIMSAGVGASTSPVSGLATLTINNTTAPTLTTAQSVALQCNSRGSVYVETEGRRPTYSAATGATATAGTGVVLQIQGSATKTVRITRIHIDGFAATAAQVTYKLQRTSVAATAGTSATLTAGAADSGDAAATAVVTHWTATGGTTGTTVGGPYLSDSEWLSSSTFVASTGNEGDIGWSFGSTAKALTLRGTADFMTLTCSGTLAASQVYVEWTEE